MKQIKTKIGKNMKEKLRFNISEEQLKEMMMTIKVLEERAPILAKDLPGLARCAIKAYCDSILLGNWSVEVKINPLRVVYDAVEVKNDSKRVVLP